jgi:MarR family transcriptional regulator for hemolysin
LLIISQPFKSRTVPSRIDPDSIGFLVADVSRLMRAAFDRAVSEGGLGLTAGEARTLSHAARAGSVRQNVLAERMGVEAMTLSAFLDRLETMGLVHRTVDPTDRRAKLVHLTDAADAILGRLSALTAEARKPAALGLDGEEASQLTSLLKRVRATLSDGRSSGDRSNAA